MIFPLTPTAALQANPIGSMPFFHSNSIWKKSAILKCAQYTIHSCFHLLPSTFRDIPGMLDFIQFYIFSLFAGRRHHKILLDVTSHDMQMFWITETITFPADRFTERFLLIRLQEYGFRLLRTVQTYESWRKITCTRHFRKKATADQIYRVIHQILNIDQERVGDLKTSQVTT